MRFTDQQIEAIKAQPSQDESGTLAVMMRARQILDRDGWMRGSMWQFGPRDGGPVCSMGAMYRAAIELHLDDFKVDNHETPLRYALKALEMEIYSRDDRPAPIYLGGVPGWNDNITRTPEEVKTMFDQAIDSYANGVRRKRNANNQPW